MMAYLTRPEPEVLPQPKPQELLDIQEQNKIERQQDTMDKARPFLMDESLDFIEREEFDQGGMAKLLKYVEDLPKGSVVTRQMLIDFVEKNNLDVNIPNFISQKVPKIKNKKFITDERVSKTKEIQQEYRKGVKFYEDKGLKPNMGSIRANVRLNKGKFTPPKGKLRGEKGLSGLFKNYEKTDLLKDLKAGKTPYEISIEYLDKNEKDILKTLEGKPDFSKPLKRLSTELTNAISKDKELDKLYKKILNKKTLTKKIEPKQYNRNVKTLLPIAQEQGLIPKVNSKGEKIDTASKYFQYAYKQKRDPIAKLFNYAEKIGIEHPAGIARAIIFNDPATLNEVVATLPDTNTLAGQTFDKYATGQAKFFERTGDSKYIKSLNKIINQKAKEFGKPKTTLDVKEGKVVRRPTKFSLTNPDFFIDAKSFINEYIVAGGSKRKNFDKLDPVLQDSIKQYEKGETIKGNQKLKEAINKILGQKKLTALQELASRTGAGVDPSLLMKAGFEEFVKPTGKFAGQVARGVGTAADLAISAGKGGTGLALGALLEADPIITGMSEGKDFGQTARDTFVGSAIDLIPGVNLGSLNEDLIKLADTEEQRIAIQNLIDYQKDYDRFNKDFRALKSYNQLNQVELEELGFTASDLVDIENKLAKRFKDIQTRAPKVYNPEVFSLARELATKEAMKRKENLETGIAGKIFGDRMAKDPNFIENQIQQIMAASTGAEGATDSYTDNYRFLPQEQFTSDELDKRFDMEGGIMAANGGRIGYSSGSDGTALAIEESLEAFQRYLKAGGKLGYKDFIALGNEGVSKFFNTGGRVGFADGPINPKRRTFMKIMAGIASLPIFSKFIGKSEVAKPIVKIAGSSTKMPDWFPDLINKAMFSGTGKKIDADIMKYEVKELPGIEIYRHDDGKVFVSGKNEYGKSYEIEYEPPGYELVDETTGKAVKRPGDFIAQEEVPVNVDPDGNADFDVEVLEDLDQLLGSDTRVMEEFATGKKIKEMKSGEYNVGQAEARAEQAADEAAELEVFDEID